MKTKIVNNTISTQDFVINPADYLPESAFVRRITSVTNKETGAVEFIRYECLNQNDLSTFVIKVPSTTPIVSFEEFEKSTSLLKIDIPVSEVTIKPYALEYGNIKISIVAPYLKKHESGGK